MRIEYVPLLSVQRELYAIPRGMERFREYLRVLIDPEANDLRLPLASMNPMGKEHVPALLDAWIALGADRIAADEAARAAARVNDIELSLKLALCIVDDRMGGWTNRYTTELSARFEPEPLLRRGWICGMLWTSERPSQRSLHEEVASCVFRAAYVSRHGRAHTLRQMLAQEGWVMAVAGCEGPTLSPDDLAYTRDVLKPLLDAADRPTVIAALFGDEAARALGYAPLGLSVRAGLALALHDGRARS